MKNKLQHLILALLAIPFLVSCNDYNKIENTDKNESFVNNPVDYVNPFLGTAPLTDPNFIGYTPPKDWRVWAGLTFPGSSLPNAMVQASPITEYGSGAGYEYEDTEILGFTHTNKGHWNLCNIPILPLNQNALPPFKSSFDHRNEKASPAYYEVFLTDYDIQVKLTTTLRAAIHEYQFQDNVQRKILLDLGRANNKVASWKIERIANNILAGVQDMGRDKVYFFARLNQDITSLEINNEKQPEGYAIATLADGYGPIILKIGLSYVSIDNARENLQKEVGEKSFGDILDEGRETWNKFLSQIQVKGGTQKEKELFYSSLYRSFLWPALRSDTNGEFADAKGAIRQENFNYYTIPSLWDTYRNKLVLLGMLSPEVTTDVIKSLMDIGDLTGFVPTFFHGDHANPFIVGSYFRGIQNFDIEKAYQLLLNNAYKEDEKNQAGRTYLSEYLKKGYISDPDIQNPHVETKGRAGVSKTLEYAYDDYALSLLARELKDEERFKDLSKRAKNYKNVFDTKTHFMRGRLENGDWIKPFNPQYPYYEYMYREANAWQVSFFAPHDMAGLIDLYGGKDKFEEKLDSLFTLPWNPNYIARNVSSFIGQYCQGNQPDHEAPFSYYFIDKPEKSQKILDIILKNYYGVGEEGIALSGMDDAGEMSAWYVFVASGLYPLSPADTDFLVTIPVFDEIKWELNKGNKVLIKNDGNSRQLNSIRINGEKLNNYFLSHDIFKQGGNVDIETKR